jgi:Protein of unknown function (DUF3187)
MSGAAVADDPLWLPSPTTSPLVFGSLRADPSDALPLGDGEWASSLTWSYVNQWSTSWHTQRLHKNLHAGRQPMKEEELQYLLSAFPNDTIFHLDIEAWRADLLLSRGFGDGISVTARLPFISVGSPHWDAVSENFHSLLPGDRQFGRDLFLRSQTILFIHSNGRTVEQRGALERDGIGDAVISVSAPLGRSDSQRVALSIKAPTGRSDSLLGTGAWDYGASWSGSWEGDRRDYSAMAAFDRLSPEGRFFGFRRSNTWSAAAAVGQHFGSHYEVTLRGRIDSSPFRESMNGDLSIPVFYYRFGVMRRIARGRWVGVEIGDELMPQIGVDADWSLHIHYSARFGG